MDVQDYFEQRAAQGTWAPLYDGPLDARRYNFMSRREAVRSLLEQEPHVARILDLGCGSGDYALIASAHHAAYHGVDFSHTMVRQASARIRRQGQRALGVVGSGERIPYRDGSVDVVLAIGYIEYFHDPSVALNEIRRVLKDGGTLVMQSYQRELFGAIDRVSLALLRAFQGRRVDAPPMSVDRPYAPRKLDQLVARYGFARTDYRLNNFHVCPEFLRCKFPRRYMGLSEWMARSNPAFWRFLAVNYIGKYRLNKSGAAQ